MKKLPVVCPSCEAQLQVKALYCTSCETTVEGGFKLPVLARLSPEEQLFALAFLKSSGSLKEMSALLNLSYPSVRNMLDDLIQQIQKFEDETT